MTVTSRVLVYRYGLLAPTRGSDEVAEQLQRAHRYYNDLIALERARRERVREALAAHPDIEKLAAEITQQNEALQAAQTAWRARRATWRGRRQPPEETTAIAEQRQHILELSRALKETRRRWREARRARAADPAVQTALQAINAAHAAVQRRTRAQNGLYWGTYLQVEQAAERACRSKTEPRFRRWTNEGRIAVQLQEGLGVAELATGTDTRAQLDLAPQPVPGRPGKPRPRLRLRVRSEGRTPVWAEWPLVLHRPLPEAAVIKWIVIHRKRLASTEQWFALLTIELPAGTIHEPCGRGRVAVNFGWRQRDENGLALRVAALVNDSGHEEELRIEPEVIAGHHRADHIRGRRAQTFNDTREWLLEWLKTHNPACPAWLAEATATLAQWRSPARLAGLALRWRQERWEGDAESYERLEAWRHWDKRLWLREVHGRARANGRRQDQYRRFAAALARRAGTLVLDNTDFSELARRDRDDAKIPAARFHRQITAVGELRRVMREAFLTRGGEVIEVRAAGLTEACHHCGLVEAWDRITQLSHTCSGCGKTYDQDANACRNALARQREQPSGVQDPGSARAINGTRIGPATHPPQGRWARRKASARNMPRIPAPA